MFCSKCGTEVPDDSTFCNKCGSGLSPAAATPPPPAAPVSAVPPQQGAVEVATQRLPGGATLGSGETVVHSEELAVSLILFFLKIKVAVTNRRIVGQWPTTFLGLIPVGSSSVTYPLTNVASVATGTSILLGNLIVGAILTLIGLYEASDLWWLLVIGILLLVNAFPASFNVTNNAGQKIGHNLAIFERAKAQELANQTNSIIANMSR